MKGKFPLSIMIWLSGLMIPVSLTAQNIFKVIIRDDSAVLTEIGKNVYVIIHNDATDEWPHGNTGVLVGDKNICIIDATYLPSRSKKDIKLIKQISSKPVKYLVFTHWHFDHNNGTISYLDEYPDIKIISEKETADFIHINGIWWSRSSTTFNSNKRKSLQKLEEQLSAGKDTSGKEFSDSAKSSLSKTIEQRKNELAELKDLKVVKPNTVFSNEMTVDLGNMVVLFKDWGKANSPHDVSVYIPKMQIFFTGDILVESPLPFVGASWPVTWVTCLRKIGQMQTKIIVPGHGPVMNNKEYLHQFEHFLDESIKRVTAMIFDGKTLIEAQHANFDDLRRGPWKRADVTDEDWNYIISTLVERIWKSVRGQG
ncbi:MAG TPA: MBL fold metallo-hydrolase [Flavisolibacter sp.]|nr:MBL fold metallo-hydrolase [Flavisolibacter sp.]